MSETAPKYLHGHHESVLRSHTWRTAANSAAYLLEHLKPNYHILDIGCGPGTITADLAALVPNGKVLGLDHSSEVLEQARATASKRDLKNIDFTTGDVHALQFPDATFDVVHIHQVLQHIPDPVRAFAEMRRVTKPVYLRTAESVGGTPKAGRHLIAWARKGGFDRSDITVTVSTWAFTTPQDRIWWGELWADRILSSSFAKSAIEGKIATQEDLERYSKAWRTWEADEDGYFALMHGEVICRVN